MLQAGAGKPVKEEDGFAGEVTEFGVAKRSPVSQVD